VRVAPLLAEGLAALSLPGKVIYSFQLPAVARSFDPLFGRLRVFGICKAMGALNEHPAPCLRVIVLDIEKPIVGVVATFAGFLQEPGSKGVTGGQPVGEIPEKQSVSAGDPFCP
jgi:hypothetical protein